LNGWPPLIHAFTCVFILATPILLDPSHLVADDRAEQAGGFDAAPAKSLLAAGRRMISEFKSTRYSHKTLIDRERGICEVDCSGFIVTLLRQTSPGHLKQIATRHKRPLAEDFYAVLAPAAGELRRGWQPIKRMDQVEPGDVIAWVKQDREPGDNTGHVVLVDEKPLAETPHRYRVRVLDSTLHGHALDSRAEGQSGIGRGTLWLDVDDQQRPIGFRWKSRKGMLHQVPIAAGRAVAFR
jgi:hypothetical protein